MPRPLNKQVVVITGASSGMGRAAALRFGKAGAKVILAARSEDTLRSAADEIISQGGTAHIVVTDVADWQQMQHLAEEAVRMFGRIDTWVNDAAVAVYALVNDMDIDEIEQQIQVNLLGTIYGVKAALPYMKQQDSGTIINITSVEGVRAVPYHSVYAASKHGVKGFTEALRMELQHQKSGIHITQILPSAVNTPFFTHARSKIGAQPRPIPPVYRPELVAEAIVEAAQHPQRDIFIGGPGPIFQLLGGLSPKLGDWLMMTGDTIFRAQKTDQPPTSPDNLYQPSPGPGRIEGDFGYLTKPSLYTRIFELTPRWQQIGIPAALVTLALIFRSRP